VWLSPPAWWLQKVISKQNWALEWILAEMNDEMAQKADHPAQKALSAGQKAFLWSKTAKRWRNSPKSNLSG